MTNNHENKHFTTVPNGVGDAVGVKRWFVAIVNNNTEKASLDRLVKLGYEAFVAKQLVLRVWKNGRKSKIDKVVIPSMVFIKCTEKERRKIVSFPFINKFLTNRAAQSDNGLTRPLAVIPQRQIDMLRFMLGQSDIPVSFTDTPLKQFDKVKVLRGSLKGVEGEIISVGDGKSDVIVRIDALGSARIKIDSVNLCIVN